MVNERTVGERGKETEQKENPAPYRLTSHSCGVVPAPWLALEAPYLLRLASRRGGCCGLGGGDLELEELCTALTEDECRHVVHQDTALRVKAEGAV